MNIHFYLEGVFFYHKFINTCAILPLIIKHFSTAYEFITDIIRSTNLTVRIHYIRIALVSRCLIINIPYIRKSEPFHMHVPHFSKNMFHMIMICQCKILMNLIIMSQNYLKILFLYIKKCVIFDFIL